MTRLFYFRAAMVIMAVIAISVAASVPMAQAAPPPEAATASGGTVPQSGNCPAGRQQDEHCLPGIPGSPAGSNSTPTPPGTPPVQPPTVPPPGIPPEELPNYIWGRANATLHIHDENQDVTYTSGEVPLVFLKAHIQEGRGTTQYLLDPVNPGPTTRGNSKLLWMTWAVTGRVFDCTVEGTAIITFPFLQDPNIPGGGDYADPRKDPTLPAYGYMNVVGLDGGDFHSVTVKLFDPDARLTKTCPGNPPVVTKEPFQAHYLLHIPWQENFRVGDRVLYWGKKIYDEGDPLDFLNLLPPGAAIPDDARRALQASGSGTSLRYTWEWALWGLAPKD